MMRLNDDNNGKGGGGGNASSPARVLNMALSAQLLQQQIFRKHQEQYLAPNPNRKPSEDDLFQMASMLLNPAAPEEQSLTPNDGSNNSTFDNVHNSNLQGLSNVGMMQQPQQFASHVSPSNSMVDARGTITGMAAIPFATSSSRNPTSRQVSPTIDDDLFDDDELDLVLGGVDQQQQQQQQLNRPMQQSMQHSMQQSMQQQTYRVSSTITSIQQQMMQLQQLQQTALASSTLITPNQSERGDCTTEMPSLRLSPNPLPAPSLKIENRPAINMDNLLPAITLEDMLQSPRSRDPQRGNQNNSEEHQDEWCLIDFGDDDLDMSPANRKRPSFDNLLDAADVKDSGPPQNKKKKSRQ